jgi:glycosyltransferase involved in cell wall biosynthesis
MAAGLPVIASDISGVRELLKGDAGLLFPVGDAAQLAEHLEQLIVNPDTARKLGQNARASIISAGLDWQRSAQCYADLYASLIHRSCAE